MATEKRLIDANKYPCRNCGKTYCYQNCKEFIEWLENPVDAVEVVRGEWTIIEDDYCGLIGLECSHCEKTWWFDDESPIGEYHFCPGCGADMRERKDNGRTEK